MSQICSLCNRHIHTTYRDTCTVTINDGVQHNTYHEYCFTHSHSEAIRHCTTPMINTIIKELPPWREFTEAPEIVREVLYLICKIPLRKIQLDENNDFKEKLYYNIVLMSLKRLNLVRFHFKKYQEPVKVYKSKNTVRSRTFQRHKRLIEL